MNVGAAGAEHASWRPGRAYAVGIRELVERAVAVDGVAAVSGHLLDALDAGTAQCSVISDPAGGTSTGLTLSGVAVAAGADPAEVVVDPVARGVGLGTGLVTAALDRSGAVWAYGDLPAAAVVADRLGLDRGRVLLQQRRALDAAVDVEPQWPAGVRVRTFVPGQDEPAFLEVNARAFAWHPEQGRLDLDGLRADMAQDWFDPTGFFLAVTDPVAGTSTGPSGDRVVGFHWTKVHAVDATPGLAPGGGPGVDGGPVGEVYVIGVDPDAGIRGLGGPLTTVGLRHLRERGLQTVMLYVEGDNEPALRLYRRFGFGTHLTNVVYRRG